MNRAAQTVVATLALAAAAHAGAEILLVTDERQVVRYATDQAPSFDLPVTPFADFNVPYHSSTLSGTMFSGSGSGYGESDFDFLIIESKFDVTFAANDPTDISLSGNFAATPGDFGLAVVSVTLYSLPGPGQTSIFADSISADFEPVEGTFAFNDELPPGVYRLVLNTAITPGGFDTTGDWSFTAAFSPVASLDSDGDGIDDPQDNCSAVANPAQVDADGDGYGNRCDGDFNNDCSVGPVDLGILKQTFFGSDAVTDLNSDGVVNPLDLGILKGLFFMAPGPSGLTGQCQS